MGSIDAGVGIHDGVKNNTESLTEFRINHKIPVFFGEPESLSNDQLESCRFSNRRFWGSNLQEQILTASISYFNEIRRLEFPTGNPSNRSEYERMRHPFVFKYPDDIPDTDMLDQIITGFWKGIRTIGSHVNVRDWEYKLFNPEISGTRVIYKDKDLDSFSGQTIWDHEYDHAKKAGDGYISISLLLDKQLNAPPIVKLRRGFFKHGGNSKGACSLEPQFPSSTDYRAGFNYYEFNEALNLIESKPWWPLIKPELQDRIKRGHNDTIPILTNVESDLFINNTDNVIDRSKIASIEKPRRNAFS